MLSKAEAAALLSIINAHHGNVQWADIQLESFWSELSPSMTVVEAREAVRRFYASTPDGWCKAGHINRIVKQMRAETKPSELQISREIERLTRDCSPLDVARYRRERLMGADEARAAQIARSDAPWPISAKPAGVSRRGETRMGDAGLRSLIGGA